MVVKVVNKYKASCYEYCGRPSVLGNPFSFMPNTLAIYQCTDRNESIDKYAVWFKKKINENNVQVVSEVNRLIAIAKIRDLNLGCFCAPKRCHCDVIKDYIDSVLFQIN